VQLPTRRLGTSTEVATGTLLRLARWPVKAMGGEFLAAATVERQRIAGDPRHTVVDLERDPPRHLTAAEASQLLRWKAAGRVLHGPMGQAWTLDDLPPRAL
jgi:uncharacterized protein YcbX